MCHFIPSIPFSIVPKDYSKEILLVNQIYISNPLDRDTYEKNVINNGKFGYDVMVVDSSKSGYTFDYSLCNYYLHDKKNLLFDRKPLNSVFFTYETQNENDNVKMDIYCENSAPHELNILFQNTKAFSLAKTLGYKYVLRLECDMEFNDFDIKNINDKIKECILNDNKTSVMKFSEDYMGFHVTFWDIDYYFYIIGKILNQKDWEKLLHKHNLSDNGIERILPQILKNNYLIFEPLTTAQVIAYRFKETMRFFDSNVIIDFFKTSDDRIYFASTNHNWDRFPEKLIIRQYVKDTVLTNGIGNSNSVSWVYIDQNVDYIELEVDDKIYKLTGDEVKSTKNVISFMP